MIIGLGSDLCNIERIQASLDRFGDRFEQRVFTDVERAKAARRPFTKAGTLAKRFAAKEAFSKAVGTGVRGWSLREVEVLHDPLGKPVLRLHGRAAQQFSDYAFSLSISHTDTMAAAVVLAEKQGGK